MADINTNSRLNWKDILDLRKSEIKVNQSLEIGVNNPFLVSCHCKVILLLSLMNNTFN